MSRCFTMVSQVGQSSHIIRRQLMFIIIMSELCSFIFSIPSAHFNLQPTVELDFEKCVYQANSANKLFKTVYGQCQSMNGPDGPSALRLSSHNSPMRINFEIVEMPAHMQLDAVTFVSEALNQKKEDFDEAANHLCRMLDQKYPERTGTNWGCIVGSRFDYSIEASPGKYMLFYIGSIQVMAYVPK
ncbi:Dynein light chain 2, cytoplasmic [Tyrophagus putrescentiae]|nr:Dynein light chain 2, cytoplasmic [Tyrophagus putrescentiae]